MEIIQANANNDKNGKLEIIRRAKASKFVDKIKEL
jgi:hypothetical protein